MASMQETVTSCEVDEEEYEEYDEVKIEEDAEFDDYKEYFEEEEKDAEIDDYKEYFEEEEKDAEIDDYEEYFEEEEKEINQKEEEKKYIDVQKVDEEDEEESAQEPVRAEEKSANCNQPSESEGNAFPSPSDFHSLLQSVSDLEKLHCALSNFLYQWNYFKRCLDSINAAIDAHAPFQHDARSSEQKKDERSEQAKEKDERSRVEILCEEMEGKLLRRYVESNLSDIDRLRNEVPEALRRIPNPEKLVLHAAGKFYTQGRKAYNHDMHLVSCRRAGILLLEFFVLSGRPTGDSSVKEEAKHGALLWWKRLVNENIESATAEDSLGLILFLACFGIPKIFDSKDLCILLTKSNLKKNIDVFRRSSILVEKIPGVIKDLIKAELYFEVAELSCYFGLTEAFPPLPLLSSFVAKVIQTGNLERKRSQDLPSLVKEVNIRQLKSLKSVVEFLKDHKLDAHDLSSVNIHKEISNLQECIEKDEIKFREKTLKRKSPHASANKKPETQFKEPFPSATKVPHRAPSQPSFPDSKFENSVISAEISNSREYSYDWGRRYYDLSAGYEPSAMEYFRAPQFCQSKASVYGNGSGISGRNLYGFVDNVIQHEERLRKSYRSSNSSPGGAKYGYY